MTLYYLLAGQVPFAEGSAADKLKQHAEASPAPLARVREDVPEDLQKIIDRMTAKDPAQRFQSPEEVADALRNINFGGDSKPPSPNVQREGSPFARWFGGLALASLIAGMCFVLYGREERVAKADYEALTAFLQSGEREEDPSRIVERLIRSEKGREYLHQIDRENDTLAFAEGKFAREYKSVVAFTHDDRLAVMGWNKNGLGQSISNIPNGFSLESISFENKSGKERRAFVKYVTGEQERGLLGDLKPHSEYESSILLDHLIKGPANIRDVFSEGTLVRSSLSQPSIPAAIVNPRLRLFGKTVTGDGIGIPKTHTWEFSGRDVGEMNLRLLVAKDGEATVIQEFRLGEVPPEFTTKARLDLKDPFGADRRRTVDATLYVDLPTGSQAYTTNEDKGVSIEIEAPFAAGITREGLPEIAADESELLFAKGYWTSDFSHGQSMEEMTAATKGTTATFLFVTVDWKPLDPAVAQQRRVGDANEGQSAESRVIQRLLDHGEHPLNRLTTLICKAAGIPNEQWEDFAGNPNASSQDIDGTPLSWALLSLEVSDDKPETATEFRYVDEGPPKPNAIHNAMAASKTLGYYSVLQPEHLEGLKFLVKGVEGQTARLEGDFGFELPGICAGKVKYVAEVDENAGLKVTEFSLPKSGVTIQLDDDGIWQRVVAEAKSTSRLSLVARTSTTGPGKSGKFTIPTWHFEGRDVGDWNVRLWLAQDGKAKVIQEASLVDGAAGRIKEGVSLVISEVGGFDDTLTVTAKLKIGEEPDSPLRVSPAPDEAGDGIFTTITNPNRLAYDCSRPPEIMRTEQSELLYSIGYQQDNVTRGYTVAGCIAATKDTDASFIYVTCDWTPLDTTTPDSSDASLADRLRQSHGNDVVEIAEAVCKAAGVPNAQWRAFGRNPATSEVIEGEPLSVVMPKKFCAIPGQQPPKPTDLHGAMAISTARGYYSMLQPQYITDLAYDVAVGEDAVKLTGRIHFNGLGLYAGKVNFRADVVEKKDSDVAPAPLAIIVTEFTIPELGFSLQNDTDGLWVKSETERSSDDEFADDYDLSQVPAQAVEVYGFSPRRLAQDATYRRAMVKLSQSRGTIAVSLDENLEQALWTKLPDGLTESDARIGILTVAEGTSLDFALKLSGREYATVKELAEEFGVEDGEMVWELFRAREPTPIAGSPESLCFQIVSEKTLLIGQSDALAIHGKLWSEPRNEDFLAATTRLNKVDHQVFALAKSMDQSHLSQIVESSAMPAFRDFVFQYLPIFTDSSYLAMTLSLNEDPRLEVFSTLKAANKQASVTSVMKNLVASLRKLANGLPTERSRVDKGGEMHLTPAAKAALTSALSDAKVTEPSTMESRLTISLFDVEQQLRPYIEESLNAVNSRRRLYDVASRNNLRQLAMGFHLFADAHGYFPSVKTMLPDAKHPVSWRVAILPYINEEKLFEQYNLDEPWDSENNRKLADKTPRVFRHPSQRQDVGCTNYVVVAGADTATGDGSKPMKLDDIADGSSQTILLAEALARIPWTKPEDPILDSSKSLPELGGMFESGFQVALADGAVQPIPADITDEVLKALITRNGGERINEDVFGAEEEAEDTDGPDDNGAEFSLEDVRKAMIGSWRSVKAVTSGREILPEIMQDMRVDISEDRYAMTVPGTGKFATKPWSDCLWDIHRTEHGLAIELEADENFHFSGLIRFDSEDRMLLCLANPDADPPTELVSRPHSPYSLDVLERISRTPQKPGGMKPRSTPKPGVQFKIVMGEEPDRLRAQDDFFSQNMTPLAMDMLIGDLNWTPVGEKPSVIIHFNDPMKDSLIIEGVLNPASGLKAMMATWREGNGEVMHRQRESQPLKSVNEAIQLLHSFYWNDGRLESLAKWNDVKPTKAEFNPSRPIEWNEGPAIEETEITLPIDK